MSETKDAPKIVAEPQAGKIVSAGKPTLATVGNQQQQSVIDDKEKGAGGGTGGTELTDEQKAAAEALKNKLPEVNDDQLRELLKGKGIELDDKGFDGLKEKLKPAPAAAVESTAEEKEQAEKAFEKRMLDVFIAQGGNIETFAAFKQLAATDLTELSVSELKREMKGKGFDDEDIALMIKERYYQIDQPELDALTKADEESQEDFDKRKEKLLKKVAFGKDKINARGSKIKKDAEDALNVLRTAVETEDLLKQTEAKLSSKVDETAKNLPRKITFQLGQVNDQEIAPIEYDVNEADIAKVTDVLKDPEKRKQFLYNQDGSLNLDNITNIMLKNEILESALKASFLEGSDRQVAEFEKIFPGRIAKDIGVGGAKGGAQQGRKGVIVSAGKPVAATPNR